MVALLSIHPRPAAGFGLGFEQVAAVISSVSSRSDTLAFLSGMPRSCATAPAPSISLPPFILPPPLHPLLILSSLPLPLHRSRRPSPTPRQPSNKPHSKHLNTSARLIIIVPPFSQLSSLPPSNVTPIMVQMTDPSSSFWTVHGHE